MARLPLMLLSAASRRPSTQEPLPLAARALSFGSSGADLVHGGLAHGSFDLGLTSSQSGAATISFDVSVQLTQTLRHGARSFVSAFSAVPLVEGISWRPDATEGASAYSDARVAGFSGLLPDYDDESMRALVSVLRGRLDQQYSHLMHLVAMRTSMAAVYEKRDIGAIDDVTGAEAVHLLESDDGLLSAVTEWYKDNLQVDLEIDSEAKAFGLLVSSSTASANLAQAGQGLQQVLPIVTYLCGMARDALSVDLLVLEEPELHLHPAVHGSLADLLVAAISADLGARQVIVETHSENLVLRIRRHVAAGALDPAHVNILWFDNALDGAIAREITIRPDGSVTDWPRGVFSEDLAEVRAIALEGRR